MKSIDKYIIAFCIVALIALAFLIPEPTRAQTQVPQGGTGNTSFPAGNFLYGNATGKLLSTSSPTVGYLTATSGTSTLPRVTIATAINLLGEYITNATTWVRSKIDAYLTGDEGIAYSSGSLSFDCSEVEGTGINCVGEDITQDVTGNWTGTFDGLEGSSYLSNSFSTTSASYFASVGLSFSTTSSNAWFATKTTADLTEGANLYYTADRDIRFSTTSASYFSSLGLSFSTTSNNYWETQQTARTADDLTNNSIEDLNDVAAITENYGDLLGWNGSTWTDFATSTLFNTAASGVTGLLSSSDWATFNAKESALTFNYPLSRSVNAISSAATSTAYANLASSLLFVNSTGVVTATTSLGLNYIPSCVQITGTVDLCDGSDASGAGGSFATTSADYWIGTYNKGFFFSTTSANAWAVAGGYLTSVDISDNTNLEAGAGLDLDGDVLDCLTASPIEFGCLDPLDFASFNSRLSTTTLGLFDKGFFFSTTSADAWGLTKGYLTSTFTHATGTTLSLSIASTSNLWISNLRNGLIAAGAIGNTYGLGTTSCTISSPLSGSLTCIGSGSIGIQNADADSTTKGAASFASPDFNAASGNISIDYTNGTAASASAKGFLTAANWITFNSKVATGTAPTLGQLAYWGNTSASPSLYSVATGTVTSAGNLTFSSSVRAVIGGALTIAVDLASNFAWTGVHDFGAAVIEMTNSTNPTVDAIGEFALDTTTNQFLVASSTNASHPLVFSAEFERCSTQISTSSLDYWGAFAAAGTTTMDWGARKKAEIVTHVSCYTDAGTTTIRYGDGTNFMNYMQCGSGTNSISKTLGSNNSFTALEKRRMEVGTLIGAMNTLVVCEAGLTTRD
jgi:hypothetical protein